MTSPFANFDTATTAEGRKLWELATKPLKTEFDGTKAGYPLFKSQLRNRISKCLWQDIVTFNIDSKDHSLVDNADLIPIALVHQAREQRQAIILGGVIAPVAPDPANAVAGHPGVTQAQLDAATLAHFRSTMLHSVLVDSVTGDLEQHVAELQNQNRTHDDGPTLLKLIQDKSRGKAVRQQMSNVRNELKNLSLKEHKWDVSSFNARLKALISTLRNNEEPFLHTDVADAVIKNCKSVKHEEFRTVIITELNAADKANEDPDWEELLELGEAKFQAMTQAGEWGKRTSQEEQLFVLQAQIKELKALAAQTRGSKGTTATATSTKLPSSSSSPSSTGGSASKSRSRDPKKKPKHPDWKFIAPTDGRTTMTKTVTINGVEKQVVYHWCLGHNNPNGGKGMWVAHKPSECKSMEKLKQQSSSTGAAAPKLQAHTVILDEDQE